MFMSFLIRNAEENDVYQIVQLAEQFSLLNLPPDETVITSKIRRSIKSFAGQLKKDEAEYMFVLEDTESRKVVGSSTIIAKHGTDDDPHSFLKVMKKERFSQDLGVGFIHTVLRFQQSIDGPTELGGLLIDKNYRGRPEKLGKQVSLVRFAYIGMFRERFENEVLVELTAPQSKEGRSEFWEAFGRRFTGLPYQEADRLSHSNKEFIQRLFPEEDIYLTLLDSRARFVLGRVGEDTMPAKHLLESVGFKYVNEVDPFDGGPHYGCKTDEIKTVKDGSWKVLMQKDRSVLDRSGIVSFESQGKFCACNTSAEILDDQIAIPQNTMDLLKLKVGDRIYWAPLE
jgi:arginine N-succinyltransferase